jgi:hypothetical protein
MLAFLVLSLVVLAVVSNRYLLPAIEAARGADPAARKELAAISVLVLVLVLFCLLAILVLLFRPARLLFPRNPPPRTRTRYEDAWSESARRMETPPKE